MANINGTIAVIDPGHNLIMVVGSVSTTPGNVYTFFVSGSPTITRDGLTCSFGNLQPTDTVVVTDDGSGNVSSIVATTLYPL